MQLLERDEPLAALHQAYASATAASGRVVLVTGEPGIGKTSLVERFGREIGDGAHVLTGTCDDLSIARPLGPLADLIGEVSAPLDAAIASTASPQTLHPLLLAELDIRSRPTVLVLEDVHWADDATLDAITFLTRRISTLPAVLVLTLRVGEAPPEHPVHAALASVRPADAVFVELAPLSEAAVRRLAGRHAERVYAETRGNPFYVAELLAFRDRDGVPPSVVTAVAGRASRLEPDARRLVELVAAVPRRVATSVLDAAFPGWTAAAAEPERRHLLEIGPRHVRFRHELVRHAVEAGIPASTRRSIHADILAVLLAAEGDPADIVHHAERAGAEEVVAAHVLVAARRAASAGANREAYAHYHRALDFLDGLPREEQGLVLEELAEAAYLLNRLEDAIAAAERAVQISRDLGDREAVGRCIRVLSTLHWHAGHSVTARIRAAEAVETLEALGESSELACAYAGLAQLAMVGADTDAAIEWGNRALDLATRLGHDDTRAHTLVTLATVELQSDPDNIQPLLEARRLAEEAGSRRDAARAIANLGNVLLTWGRPREAWPVIEAAVEYAEEHEIHNLRAYASANLAWLHARAGAWEEAERLAAREARSGPSVSRIVAETVLAELAVRRGDDDADARLGDLLGYISPHGDVQRVHPIVELAAERSLTVGTAPPTDRLRGLLARGVTSDRMALRIAATAALVGEPCPPRPSAASPYSHLACGDWRAAADAFDDAGWPYDRALMLSLLDDEEALLEALATARRLGAEPLAERVTRRLRDLGARVPRGPYASARGNPAGLTARQLQVLRLVVAGRTNVEIADELVVSPRTAEHHVAAVLAKLGAASRRDVASRAAELGLSVATR
jgi:DNA-binding CsgD family transcriptional regulator/tetratricopeptide (TPR) repeat protein